MYTRCATDGCQNPTYAAEQYCTGCTVYAARLAEQRERKTRVESDQGFPLLLEYLAKWAEFEQLYGAN